MTIVVLGATVSPAWGNFVDADGEGAIYRANNEYHWFAYAPSVGNLLRAATEEARTVDFEPTDLVTSFHGAGVPDSTNWDVYFEKCHGTCVSNPDFDAEVECRWLTTYGNGDKVCSHWHVFFNGNFTDSYGSWKMQGLACHEVGHSVGLLHTNTSPGTYKCMEQHTPDRTSKRLGSHNTVHIDLHC